MLILACVMGMLFYAAPIMAIPTVVPDPIPCVLELETHFFLEPIVSRGLSLYNIRQELWLPINQRLRKKNLEVPERVKRRTAYMVPNPLEYPMQKAIIARILKEVLFEVFMEVMQEYHEIQRPEVNLIFDYIFDEQLPRFVSCFGPEVQRLK
jgi:hypothetical protein